jgi:hypothetical protein
MGVEVGVGCEVVIAGCGLAVVVEQERMDLGELFNDVGR